MLVISLTVPNYKLGASYSLIISFSIITTIRRESLLLKRIDPPDRGGENAWTIEVLRI